MRTALKIQKILTGGTASTTYTFLANEAIFVNVLPMKKADTFMGQTGKVTQYMRPWGYKKVTVDFRIKGPTMLAKLIEIRDFQMEGNYLRVWPNPTEETDELYECTMSAPSGILDRLYGLGYHVAGKTIQIVFNQILYPGSIIGEVL